MPISLSRGKAISRRSHQQLSLPISANESLTCLRGPIIPHLSPNEQAYLFHNEVVSNHEMYQEEIGRSLDWG